MTATDIVAEARVAMTVGWDALVLGHSPRIGECIEWAWGSGEDGRPRILLGVVLSEPRSDDVYEVRLEPAIAGADPTVRVRGYAILRPCEVDE